MTLPHLDDDQLNAHLDGEDAGAGAPHLASCVECGARLADLRAAQAAVGSHLAAPDAATRDAAITAALDAWAGDDAGGAADPDTTPLPLRRSGAAVPRWLVAAAVLVVLGLVAVPFMRMAGDGPSVSTAARDNAETAHGATAPADLGAVDSDLALNDRLRTVLGLPGPADAEGAGGASSAYSSQADLRVQEAAPAALSDASAGNDSDSYKAIGSCQAAAKKLAGEAHTTLAFSASLVYRGTPGYVYVFIQQDGERLSRRAVVLDRSACSPLVVQSF